MTHSQEYMLGPPTRPEDSCHCTMAVERKSHCTDWKGQGRGGCSVVTAGLDLLLQGLEEEWIG